MDNVINTLEEFSGLQEQTILRAENGTYTLEKIMGGDGKYPVYLFALSGVNDYLIGGEHVPLPAEVVWTPTEGFLEESFITVDIESLEAGRVGASLVEDAPVQEEASEPDPDEVEALRILAGHVLAYPEMFVKLIPRGIIDIVLGEGNRLP